MWPAWEWTRAPSLRWLFASYGAALAIRDSLRCRRLIEGLWYQDAWGNVYQLTSDQNAKSRYENDRTGYRLATSVGGTGTGEGGDRLVIDDPHNAREAESETRRLAVLDWWDGTMSTRANDPASVVRVIIMQRLHEQDLVGHLLEKMREGGQQYDHLILPARYEPTAQVCLGGLAHDPRTTEGALLSPERFDDRELRKLEIDLGPDKAAGQLQQRPGPAGGALFRRDWWAAGRNRYDATADVPVTQLVGRWLFVDTGMKDQERHDFTALGGLELLPDYRARLRTLWREKLQFPDLVANVEATATAWHHDGLLRGVVIEDKGSGTSALQSLRAGAEDWLVELLVPFAPQGSKVYRARQASLWAGRDCILLPEPSAEVPWLFDFELELFGFPSSAHDDQVDVFTMGILFLEHLLAEGWRARGGARSAA